MQTENRRHTRARIKWPVVIQTPTGLIDGTTVNLSLRGAFIRLSNELNSNHNLPVVLNAKGRFIPCTAQVVWSDERTLSEQRKFLEIGVRFTRLMLHDREFLYGEIKSHLTYIREVSRKALYKLERGRVRELVYWIPYILYFPNVALAKNKIRATERFSIYP